MKLDCRLDVYHHNCGEVADKDEVLKLLRAIFAQGEKMARNIEEANEAIAKIDAATTKIGETQAANGAILLEISTDLDEIITELGQSVPEPLLAKLKAAADAASAISASDTAQADYLKALAAKWTSGGPVVPPEPTPEPVVFSRNRGGRRTT